VNRDSVQGSESDVGAIAGSLMARDCAAAPCTTRTHVDRHRRRTRASICNKRALYWIERIVPRGDDAVASMFYGRVARSGMPRNAKDTSPDAHAIRMTTRQKDLK
jgi:hypothetical protein